MSFNKKKMLTNSSQGELGNSDVPSCSQGNQLVVANDLDEREIALFNMVFGIDHLRERIINSAIREGGKASPTLACKCRQVNKSWMESVGKCLCKAGQPLFRFNVEDSDRVTPSTKIGQFLNSCITSSRVFEYVPPFELSLTIDNNTPTMVDPDIIGNCLRWGSSGLINLDLTFDETIGSTKVLEESVIISLPVLRKLKVCFPDWEGGGTEEGDSDIEDTVQLVQLILAGSKKLVHFEVNGMGDYDLPVVPDGTFRLPDTLTRFSFDQRLTTSQLEALMLTNNLPKLANLSLKFEHASNDNTDLIYRILDRFRRTLKAFSIQGDSYEREEDRRQTPIHLPMMECLERLDISATNWKFSDGLTHLERKLPVIKTVIIGGPKPTGLLEFLQHSRLESAKSLYLCMHRHDNFDINEDLPAVLKYLPVTFPKITTFEISTAVRNVAPHVFHDIFVNMPQLERLCLSVYEDTESPVTDSHNFWNLMFLGMPPDEITDVQVALVTKMSGLRRLQLSLDCSFRVEGKIPDEVFELGFFKMPKLLTLVIQENFKVSAAMAKKWKKEGRQLIK